MIFIHDIHSAMTAIQVTTEEESLSACTTLRDIFRFWNSAGWSTAGERHI